MLKNAATNFAESLSVPSNHAKSFYALLTMFLALLLIAGTLAKDEGLFDGIYVHYWEVLRNVIWGTIFASNAQLSRKDLFLSNRWRNRAICFFAIFAAAAYAVAASDLGFLVYSL